MYAVVFMNALICISAYADENTELQAIQENVQKIKGYGNSNTKKNDSTEAHGVLKQLKGWMEKYCQTSLEEKAEENEKVFSHGDKVCSDAQYRAIGEVLGLIEDKLTAIDLNKAIGFQGSAQFVRKKMHGLYSFLTSKSTALLNKKDEQKEVKLALQDVSKNLSEDISIKDKRRAAAKLCTGPLFNDPIQLGYRMNDVFENVLLPLLDVDSGDAFSKALSQAGMGSSRLAIAARDQSIKRARREIEEPQGRLVVLEKGEYMMGPGLGESRAPWLEVEHLFNHSSVYTDRFLAMIPKDLEMGAFRVTQAQYEKVMGKEVMDQWRQRIQQYCEQRHLIVSNFIDPKKPIFALTALQRKVFLETLNAKILALWPYAYPKTKPPKPLRFPTEGEWEYATTKPLPKDEKGRTITQTVSIHGWPGKLTALHQRFPHGDEANALMLARAMTQGPYNEDEFAPNVRGIYGMGRGMGEVTSSDGHTYPGAELYKDVDFLKTESVTRGAPWFEPNPQECRSSRRGKLDPMVAEPSAALRLVRTR